MHDAAGHDAGPAGRCSRCRPCSAASPSPCPGLLGPGRGRAPLPLVAPRSLMTRARARHRRRWCCVRQAVARGRDLWRPVARAAPDRRPGSGTLALVRPVRRLALRRAGRRPRRHRRLRRRGRRLRARPRRAAAPGPERQRPGLPHGGRRGCRRGRRRWRGVARHDARVLLNGLVAVPFAFAVLTRAARPARGPSPSASRCSAAWSRSPGRSGRTVDSTAALDGSTSTTPWIARARRPLAPRARRDQRAAGADDARWWSRSACSRCCATTPAAAGAATSPRCCC